MASTEKLVTMETLEVLRLVVGPLENNVYLVRDPRASRCVVIDASFDAEHILATVGADKVVAILLTHAHMDHVHALPPLREATRAPVGVHPMEPEARDLRAEISLTHGQVFPLGHHELEVIHTPGHTPGGVSFYLKPILCFCGDSVFPGGPGRTWSPDGFRQIVRSLEERIYTLPDSVRLLPGHGEGLRVGESKRESERFRSKQRDNPPWGELRWDMT